MGCIADHVFVAHQKKSRLAIASRKPTANVFPPGSVITGTPGHKAFNELLDGVVITEQLAFALEMILRDSYIPRIASDVDDTLVARIEILVTFYDPGPSHASQVTVAGRTRSRNDAVDI